MALNLRRIIFLVLFNLLFLGQSQETEVEGRDFQGYLPAEDQKFPDYQLFQTAQNYPYKEAYEECARNPMLPILGKGLNLVLLKLGVIGIIKAVVAFIFAGFLLKIPLLLLKLVFMKSFFLPLLAAPFLMHAITSQMQTSNENESEQKPGEMSSEMPTIMGMNEMTMDAGRQLNDSLTSMAWQSMKMIAESGQCVDKISCMLGASSRDSSMGSFYKRILKYLHYSSPPVLQKKVESLREAFNKGSRSLKCLEEEYQCQIPEPLLRYGMEKMQIF